MLAQQFKLRIHRREAADFAGVARYVEGGRIFEPDPGQARIYDRAYANFRQIYERLRTLYPSLDPTAVSEGQVSE